MTLLSCDCIHGGARGGGGRGYLCMGLCFLLSSSIHIHIIEFLVASYLSCLLHMHAQYWLLLLGNVQLNSMDHSDLVAAV